MMWVAAWGQNWPPKGRAQAIVLGGETVTLGGDTLLDAAASGLDKYAQQAGLPAPVIRLARYADLATAVGGAGYVLHAILNPHQRAFQTQFAPPAAAGEAAASRSRRLA